MKEHTKLHSFEDHRHVFASSNKDRRAGLELLFHVNPLSVLQVQTIGRMHQGVPECCCT